MTSFVDAAQVRKAVAALLQYVRKRSKEGKKGKSLLGEDDDDDMNGDFVYVNLALQRVAAHDPKKGMKPRKMYGPEQQTSLCRRERERERVSHTHTRNDSDTHILKAKTLSDMRVYAWLPSRRKSSDEMSYIRDGPAAHTILLIAIECVCPH